MNLDITYYKHFSFDMWLTLIRSHPEFKNIRDQWIHHYFDIPIPLTELKTLIRKIDVEANTQSEQTGIHISQKDLFFSIIRQAGVLLDDNYNWNPFLKDLEELFLCYMPQLIDPNISLFFEKIRSKDKGISLLSNTAFITGNTLHKVLVHYNLAHYFDFELYSDEIGYSKPNPFLFELVYEKANLLRPLCKDQIIHIGENYTADYQGALEVGFQSFLLKH